MRLSKVAILALAALAISATLADANPVSGVYFEKTSDGIVMMQIVVTPDGKVAGQVEITSLSSSGSVEDHTFPLEGSLDGSQISLKSNVIFGWGRVFGGIADGNTLHLTVNNGQFDLSKSDFNTFSREKTKLVDVGNAIFNANEKVKNANIALAEKAKIQSEKNDFTDKINSEAIALELNISKLQNFEQDADKSISNTKAKRDSIIAQIKQLRQNISTDDGGETDIDINYLTDTLRELKSDFRVNLEEGRSTYDQLLAMLERFRSDCAEGTSKYSLSLSNKCEKISDWMDLYENSRARIGAKYDEGSKLFVLD